MDIADPYEEADKQFISDTHTIDGILARKRFTRMCDYEKRITPADIEDLKVKLATTIKERPIHAFLAKRPHLVVNAEGATGCRWIKSNPSLSSEFKPDFMIARRNSGGISWTLMELQDPKTQLFLGDGQPGEELREGLHQIRQWRGWIQRWGTNSMGSYGYPRLSDDFRAVIVIGRSDDKRLDLHGDDRIAELEREHRIEIRSYDHILRAAWWAVHGCGIDHGGEHGHGQPVRNERKRASV